MTDFIWSWIDVVSECAAVLGALALTVAGAVMAAKQWKTVISVAGLVVIVATARTIYSAHGDRRFFLSTLTGNDSFCFVEARRFPALESSEEPFMLWAVNAGTPSITNPTIAMHFDSELSGYRWVAHMIEPCTREWKAIHEIGFGHFYIEIDDTPGQTTYEELTIEKRETAFHQKVTTTGKQSFSWEGDF